MEGLERNLSHTCMLGSAKYELILESISPRHFHVSKPGKADQALRKACLSPEENALVPSHMRPTSMNSTEAAAASEGLSYDPFGLVLISICVWKLEFELHFPGNDCC
eukprot:scaffold22575_cov141-Cylindrotheca_fusiformis.AAC.41